MTSLTAITLTHQTDPHEGHSSAAGDVQKPFDAIVSEKAPVSQYVDESELDLADSDDGVDPHFSQA